MHPTAYCYVQPGRRRLRQDRGVHLGPTLAGHDTVLVILGLDVITFRPNDGDFRYSTVYTCRALND